MSQIEPGRRIPFEFHAHGGEYFRIWIVNLLLTLLTFGVYSAWAKVRRLRYFYANTRLEGAAFDYHGRPIQILKGRLIAAGAYALFYFGSQIQPLVGLVTFPFFVFGVPWIIQRARRFQMRMTSHRGLRFGFDGTYGGAFSAYVGWFVAAALTLFALFPHAQWKRAAYLANHTRYGSERFRLAAAPGRFYVFNAIAGVAGLLVVAAVGIALGTVLEDRELAAVDASNPIASASNMTIAALVAGAAVPAFAIGAYYRKSHLNAVFDGLEIGPLRVMSDLETSPLFGILLSNFALIVLTLGFYTPWAQVRQARYQLSRLSLVATGDLDQFVASASENEDAVGEELADFFDVDFGL